MMMMMMMMILTCQDVMDLLWTFDLLWICCWFVVQLDWACCTTNPQQIV